jgi:hypothetical protein
VQKSLKTGLRLKRYDVLKLQGLGCKFTELNIKYKSKSMARLQYNQKLRAPVQVYRIYRNIELFLKGKIVN